MVTITAVAISRGERWFMIVYEWVAGAFGGRLNPGAGLFHLGV
jgi:hypothetical protein